MDYLCARINLNPTMKRIITLLIVMMLCGAWLHNATAQERRPIDSQHPMWLVHVDVWNKADPQKIINLIPDNVKPYVVMNLSLSCQYDTAKNVYKMPQNAIRTYKSWASVCQANNMWFTCQPASGGHTHIQDEDIETFEYFYKQYPNFLGWNYAEQFWGFDEPNDKSSSSQASRIALFAKLVKMAHEYGGFLTISFCGNVWSHPLNPVGMMKRNAELQAACKAYPEAILWLYKYTTSSCFYNNESVTWSPFVAGYAKNYGVRYDNCGWNGALDAILGEKHGKKYPVAAGIGTVMEQTCVNGGAVWDGPELIWTEDFQNLSDSKDTDGYTIRNWGVFPGFTRAWLDMFSKVIDGEMYIPTREEIVKKQHIYVVNDLTSGSDEDKYAAWGDLYDGLYKQTDPFNRGNGQWMDNFCYFKKTGRYGAIPVGLAPNDSLSKKIPSIVKKSSRWSSQSTKVSAFNKYYAEVSQGDMYVNRYRNQLVTYTPYTYLNSKKSSTARIPLLYNTCDSLILNWGKLSSGLVHEYADRIQCYLNNYRTDTTAQQTDIIQVKGAVEKPTYKVSGRCSIAVNQTSSWDEENHVFSLTIKHNGPVDVVINASGNGTDRLSNVVSNTALESPKQPGEFRGPFIIEAEDMNYKNINSCVTDPYGWYPSVRGHAGNGFADMGSSMYGALRTKLTKLPAGTYDITVRYTNVGSTIGRLRVVAGSTTNYFNIEKTDKNVWKKSTLKNVTLAKAPTITLTNTAGINMYIDQIILKPSDMEDEKFELSLRQVEEGKVSADANVYAEGETVQLNAEPNAGFVLDGWRIIHGGVTISSSNTFVMPDEHVTVEPIFRDTTLVYELDYSKVLNGTLPTGWRAIQGSSEEHAWPNNYSSGGRVFSGFTGYQGKALYWRESRAEYGYHKSYPLNLQPGEYRLSFAMAAWKLTPKYNVQILPASGSAIAQKTQLQAAPNANGNTAANVSSAEIQTLDFTIEKAGKYYISFRNAGSGFDEFLLLHCALKLIPSEDGIHILESEETPMQIFGIDGNLRESLQPGINIVRQGNGVTKKVFIAR